MSVFKRQAHHEGSATTVTKVMPGSDLGPFWETTGLR